MTAIAADTFAIRYGSKTINFDLVFMSRKTLEISVYPDLSVVVKAPEGKSIDEVKERVRSKAAWIVEQKRFFSLYLPRPPKRQYVSGESHYYLGRQYRLKVIASDKEQVKLSRGCLYVHTSDFHNSCQIKKLLQNWYSNHAKVQFYRRMEKCLPRMGKHLKEKPELTIRKMKTRWGSCSRNSRIILNSHLIKAPTPCIDYVICHELCHLIHPNHSKAFYRLLAQSMPDWQNNKKRLEDVKL